MADVVGYFGDFLVIDAPVFQIVQPDALDVVDIDLYDGFRMLGCRSCAVYAPFE